MFMRISQRVVASLLFLSSLVAGIAQAAPPQRWTFVDLGTLGGGAGAYSSASHLNNRGDVVGSAWVPSALKHHGFLWQNGSMLDMGADTSVYRINDHGTMVAYVNGHPHLWKDGAVTRLPFDFALSINRSEDIVGYRNVFVGGFFSFAPRAVLFRDGVLHDLGALPGGDGSVAEAINGRGVIAGNSRFMPGSRLVHAFVYEDGVMKDLGTLGGVESFAEAINNHGVIAGTAQEPSGRFVAVVWDRAGIRRLVDGSSRAVDINNRGQVVLMGTLNGVNGTYLYDDGTVTHLDSLPEVRGAGVTRLEAHAMNDRGWITGFASRPGDSNWRAFLLIPR